VQFEWDPDKERENIEKHGVSFSEAATIFGDPLSLMFYDPDHSLDEDRYLTIGMSSAGRLVITSHTDRDDTVRIINAREVTPGEQKDYEEGNKF
jgi:uncharacterized DUF497 family protein